VDYNPARKGSGQPDPKHPAHRHQKQKTRQTYRVETISVRFACQCSTTVSGAATSGEAHLAQVLFKLD
jgi:hypothetical protein